jgi:hypothetical protein
MQYCYSEQYKLQDKQIQELAKEKLYIQKSKTIPDDLKIVVEKIKQESEEKVILLSSNLERLRTKYCHKQIFPTFEKLIGLEIADYKLSNFNKTIQKKSGGNDYIGFKCEKIDYDSNTEQYSFSIKIDHPGNGECYINVGYCLSAHDGSNGFYSDNCIGMLSLNSGVIYTNFEGKIEPGCFRGEQGMIITSILDLVKNEISFVCGNFNTKTEILLSSSDLDNICPCADIYLIDTKISIVLR